ncbi:hypothetical protein K457DRAFT_1779719 [Linnemannia elongata AG-77]|uniref:Uncharacterized protein n=1 Tax=Linnemannia elongata AG-77 TaxID=1314771 RepID=A0A197JJ78_9FUNG|nr:hypothetical protein K457DRAFT_1779719 [Linnemannia elongata AG-77]
MNGSTRTKCNDYCNNISSWVNNPTLTELCFSMIGRADIEGSKRNVAMNAWLPQASYPCGSAFDNIVVWCSNSTGIEHVFGLGARRQIYFLICSMLVTLTPLSFFFHQRTPNCFSKSMTSSFSHGSSACDFFRVP